MEAIAQAHAISVVRIRREHESGNGLELGVLLVFADGLELGSEQGLELGSSWVSLTDWNLESVCDSPMDWNLGRRRNWILGQGWVSRMDWNVSLKFPDGLELGLE